METIIMWGAAATGITGISIAVYQYVPQLFFPANDNKHNEDGSYKDENGRVWRYDEPGLD